MRNVALIILLMLPVMGCEKATRKKPLANLFPESPDPDYVAQTIKWAAEEEALNREKEEETLKKAADSAYSGH